MGFVLHGLDKSDYDREYGDMVLLKRILSYFSKYKYNMLMIGIAITISSAAATLVPIYISDVLDKLEQGIENTFITQLMLMVILFGVVNFALNAFQQILSARTIQAAVVDLREDAFDALLEKDMAFFDEQPSGRLASRISNDSRDYGQVVSLTMNLLGQVLIVFIIIFVLLNISVKLTVFTILFAPIVVFTALSFRRIARKVSQNSQRILAKVNALIQETQSGIYVAKSFRAEQSIYDEFDDMNKMSYDVNLRRAIVFNSIFPILNILIGIGTAGIVYFGGLDILQANTPLSRIIFSLPGRQLTPGEWYLFLQGLNLFFFPLVSIASFWSQFQQGLAASERIFSLIDTENTVVQVDDQLLEEIKGEIEFKGVDFEYSDGTKVLHDYNLHINPGEKIAIVGHTGAGKSTLVKLISRYYEYQNGEILIDGVDIRKLNLREYRKKLSIISQDVFLWNESIKDNLMYGIEHIDNAEERLIEVLKKVEAMDWIERLENGIETSVGERGGKLSFGQRQLIAFSRILLRDPAILIMDEATSSVDPFTEVKIQKATDLILEGRTSIIIAHRLSTIRHVDRILVMKDGKIIEEGNHDELMAQKGHYSELYDTYFRHQSLEYVESFAD
ncbi:MAG: ABC transporter ATP-binding protein [Candidatus Heimdallarchaeota archaeon]|nr:ABC transporter ATP-binding protein [Candidatus Heimdallarchaeota archaeon]